MTTFRLALEETLSPNRKDDRPKIDPREHIFFGIADLVNPGKSIDIRMRLMREFTLVQKIVNASHAGNLNAARHAQDTALLERGKCRDTFPANALDAVFLPAIALLASKEENYDQALSDLMASLDMLAAHRRAGLEDAGIGYIDQRLNCLRVLALCGDATALEAETIAFVKMLATDQCEALGSGMLRSHASDAVAVLVQFAETAISKAVQKLDRAGLGRVFAAIGEADGYLDDALPLADAAAVCEQLMRSEGDTTRISRLDVERLRFVPLSLVRTLERETLAMAA